MLKSLFVVVLLWTATNSHCPADCIPTEDIKIIRAGVAEVKQCEGCFNFCNTITTYQDSLRVGLKAKYDRSQHVIFGYIDSLKRYQKADSVFYQGILIGVDTSEWESLYVSVFSELKGNLGMSHFLVVDSMAYVPKVPFATSYRGYDGRPFMAFFDNLTGGVNQNDQMGIGPVDGCYFEPQAYIVSDSSIHKMGQDKTGIEAIDRIPGVSIRVEDFLKEIGRPGLPIPSKKTVSIQAKTRGGGRSHILKAGRISYWYDLKGRRLELRTPQAGDAVLPRANTGCRSFLY